MNLHPYIGGTSEWWV